MKITVSVDMGHPVNRFVPSHAFGSAIDGHEKGQIAQMLSARNIREMLTAGLKPLTYRLRTELAGEAWHWNPKGSWSERQRRQGYWTSSALHPHGDSISVSYGYRLPRRGNTIDQANEDGYSRIDDGDLKTFWKSNPYLDEHFTGEENSKLPQWVVIDLGNVQLIDTMKIDWAEPFAQVYQVQYGHYLAEEDISQSLPDVWQTFPDGRVDSGEGGTVTLRLQVAVKARFIRLLMSKSSGTSLPHSAEVRDRLGYAIREIAVGAMDHDGVFHDLMRHATVAADQTSVYVSSTDPWHRAIDKDPLIEQPGFDRLFRSPLTNGLPVLVPIPVLYDSPANAAAEIRYLKSRGYPIKRVELGEEPDGQFIEPEDYAALYIQFARAIREVDSTLQLGGPSFQDIEPGEIIGGKPTGKPGWFQRFLAYLEARGHLDEYTFLSFEWYPFDDVCQPSAPQLAEASHLLSDAITQMREAGRGRSLPLIITEYGYSAFGGRPEIDIEAALLNADVLGTFLTLGGEQAFLYGYEPNEIIQEAACAAGNNMLFLLGGHGNIAYRMPTYYGARLLTQEWAQPGNGTHELYRALIEKTQTEDSLVAAYPILRPDKLWSVLLLNKDPKNERTVKVKFQEGDIKSNFGGVVDLYQYSKQQYELSDDKEEPHPTKDLPPVHRSFRVDKDGSFRLPPYSMTVIRGSILAMQN